MYLNGGPAGRHCLTLQPSTGDRLGSIAGSANAALLANAPGVGARKRRKTDAPSGCPFCLGEGGTGMDLPFGPNGASAPVNAEREPMQ